jgi:hypothetical protein
VKCLLPRALGGFAASSLAVFGAYSCGDEPQVRVAVAPSPPSPPNSGFVDPDPTGGTPVDADPAQCLQETREAQALGLDIYVMLDSSLSMDDLLQAQASGANDTKWDAVKSALAAFIEAPETATIGVGLQYFPQVEPGVPFSCNSNDDCGTTGGACSNSRCVSAGSGQLPNGDSVSLLSAASDTACLDDTECTGSGQSCRSILGQCVYAPGGLDFPDGSLLPAGVPALCSGPDDCESLPGSVCEEVGSCDRLVNGQRVACTRSVGCSGGAGICVRPGHACSEQKLCQVSEYGTPAVPIRRDSSRARDILASLAARELAGPTPTGPALQGALQHAQSWAGDHPDRQVITVVVTDGFPTNCSPLGIPEIASLAENANRGAQPVHTFFVGVFSDQDLGLDGAARLDELARAGGSRQAVVINTANDVAQDFLLALDAIRDTSSRCNFRLDASGLDLDRVNLEVVDDRGTTTQLLNVGDAATCADQQGWFYERDDNGTRRQITVCPSTCRGLIGGGLRTNLAIGCATRIR